MGEGFWWKLHTFIAIRDLKQDDDLLTSGAIGMAGAAAEEKRVPQGQEAGLDLGRSATVPPASPGLVSFCTKPCRGTSKLTGLVLVKRSQPIRKPALGLERLPLSKLAWEYLGLPSWFAQNDLSI